MSIKVTQLLSVGDDILLINGERGGGYDSKRKVEIPPEPIQARGWVSAIENHLPPEAYDADGNRLETKKGEPTVAPRAMTSAEKRAYAERLLIEQNPVPVELEL